MIIPINCPRCNGPLDNEFIEKSQLLIKRCIHATHQFSCTVVTDVNGQDVLSRVVTTLDPLTKLIWNFEAPSLDIYYLLDINPNREEWVSIPFFDPDFSNWPKLRRKIKTYLMLS